jgi:peptide/nickel transport system permease protein
MTDKRTVRVAVNVVEAERGKSYVQLVWRNFKKNRMGLLGGIIIVTLAFLSLFAPFFAPHDYYKLDADKAYRPPQRIRFFDTEGRFHWRPFVYDLKLDIDPVTFSRIYREDTSKPLYIRFFVRGWEYQIFGFRSTLHLFGVEEGSIHLLGTDRLGRDLLGRILHGGRVSLTIALFGAVVTVILGSILGALSGYYGGFVDMLVQRAIEVLQSFPQLPLWMALTAALPRTWSSLQVFICMVVIFSFLNWPMLAREIRGKVLSLREQDFIVAVKEMGGSNSRAIFRHLLPNCLSHMIVVLTISIPELILMESVLSFLGLGIQPPMISWGVLLQGAQRIEVIGLYPWVMSPCAFIILAVLGFNFLGDGLRDAADPYSVRRSC